MYYAQLLLPDFALILCGYLICRYTALNRTVWAQVDSLVYYFLFPVLLVQSTLRVPLDVGTASRLIGAGWSLCAIGVLLAYSIPRWPGLGRHIERAHHAGGAQVAFRFNSFIALALSEKIMGGTGVALLSVLIGFCVPVLNAAAVWPMAHHAQRGLLRELARNPLVLATVGGISANLLGLSIPQWLAPTLTRIGSTSIVLGLMAAGAGLQLASLLQSRTLSVALLSVRHLWLPLAACALAWVWHLTPEQATMLLIFGAVPTASSAYVLAARMGYDGAYVACLVTLSTMLGVASLWFALGVLRPLLPG